MARLNDPAPTAPSFESLDALKRRFIRQNRELAKGNSIQSVRIRNLESEQVRLLSENLSLRSQIACLESDLDTVRRQNLAGNVRSQLEAKVHELAVLITDLSVDTGAKSARRRSRSGAGLGNGDEDANAVAARRRRVSGRQSGLDDLEMEAQGRLPTIREDKYFPRRTFENEELRAILTSQANDSPDLGPPPVAHFQDDIDPVKMNSMPTSDQNGRFEAAEGDDNFDPVPSVNLESRRRRRDSRKVSDFTLSSDTAEPAKESSAPSDLESKLIKAGAKRKMSNRDTEDRQEPLNATLPPPEDFQFSRKTALAKSRSPSRPDTDASTSDNADNEATHASAPLRKALSNKNVNSDPTSPRKIAAEDCLKPSKTALKPRNSSARGRKPLAIMTNNDDGCQPPAVIDIETQSDETAQEMPPKTPGTGLADLMSPSSFSVPSTERRQAKDTPPPASLGGAGTIGNGDGIAPGARAFRRARAPVNYAEPSLNSKMRRPGKELVDAVTRAEQQKDANAPGEDNAGRGASIAEAFTTPSVQAEKVLGRHPLANLDTSASVESAADQNSEQQSRRRIIIKRDPNHEMNKASGTIPSNSESAAARLIAGTTATSHQRSQVRASISDTTTGKAIPSSPTRDVTATGSSSRSQSRPLSAASTSRPRSAASDHRRTASSSALLPASTSQHSNNTSTPSTLSALITASAASRAARAARTSSSSTKPTSAGTSTFDKDEMAIFDFTGSSSPPDVTVGRGGRARGSVSAGGGGLRRHSSAAQLRGGSADEGGGKRRTTTVVGQRRPLEEIDVSAMDQSEGAANDMTITKGGSASGRSERLSARRRSMMV